MARATERSLRTQVVAAGGTLEVHVYADGSGCYMADAPPRHVWLASHTHALVAEFANGYTSWKPVACASLSKDIACGTAPCTEADCDMCAEQEVL
jgi:hypothetical protein